jgi:hypothetical protein
MSQTLFSWAYYSLSLSLSPFEQVVCLFVGELGEAANAAQDETCNACFGVSWTVGLISETESSN